MVFLTSNITRILIAISLCLPAVWQTANAQDKFSSLVVFGDSLSDNGNLVTTANPIAPLIALPPFNAGRFTNGITAVEVLAGTLDLPLLPEATGGTNFAYASASARGRATTDLRGQVDKFLTSKGGTIAGDALYIIMVGGNDVRNARDGGERFGRVITNRAVTNIYRAAKSLIDAGARKLIISNVPDIGFLPDTRLRQVAGQKGLVRKARALSMRVNSNIARIVARLETENSLDIVLFDLFSVTGYLRANSQSIGLTNEKDACFVLTATGAVFHPDCTGGTGFSEFAFFDNIHPTAIVHERIGRALYSVVPTATVAVDDSTPTVTDGPGSNADKTGENE